MNKDDVDKIIALRGLLKENRDKIGDRNDAIITCIYVAGLEFGQDNPNISDEKLIELVKCVMNEFMIAFLMGQKWTKEEGKRILQQILSEE